MLRISWNALLESRMMLRKRRCELTIQTLADRESITCSLLRGFRVVLSIVLGLER